MTKITLIISNLQGAKLGQYTFDSPLFSEQDKGKVYNVSMTEQDFKEQFVGNYQVRSTVPVVTPPHDCPPGKHWDEASQQCVPDVIPPAGLIYSCITHGKWNINRTITDFDPQLPKPFQGKQGLILAASGSNKKLVIENGIATFSSGSGHPRYYIDNPNYNTYNVFSLMFLDTNARNFTQQRQSRHNLGGADPDNCFGGFNHEVDIEGQAVALKIEVSHNSGIHIDGGSKKLPKELKPNQWLGVKNTDAIQGRNVTSKTELNFGDGWVEGISKKYDLSNSKYDFIFNAQLYRTSSSEWFRMNPNTTSKGFAIKDLEVFQL